MITLNENTILKVDRLVEEASRTQEASEEEKVVAMQPDYLRAAALSQLTPEQKVKLMDPSGPMKTGIREAIPAVGKSLFIGGLVGAGSLAANEMVDAHIDPAASAAATAAANGLIRVPGAYLSGRKDHKEFQDVANFDPKTLKYLNKEYQNTMKNAGFTKDEQKEAAKMYGNYYA